MDHNKQDKGFTLVELLIVIVILGILAGVTVFAVRGITQDANENSCAAEQRTIETAIEAYFADNNDDPADIGDLVGAYLTDNPFGAFDLNADGDFLDADEAGSSHFTFVAGPPASVGAGVGGDACALMT